MGHFLLPKLLAESGQTKKLELMETKTVATEGGGAKGASPHPHFIVSED